MIYFVYPLGGDFKDYPEPKGKFVLSILSISTVILWIRKYLRSVDIYLKYDNEGKIYFNSKKARDFFADYLEDRFFMTFCNYDGRPNECYFCGGKACIKSHNSRFKLKYILLCFNCDRKLSRLLK